MASKDRNSEESTINNVGNSDASAHQPGRKGILDVDILGFPLPLFVIFIAIFASVLALVLKSCAIV